MDWVCILILIIVNRKGTFKFKVNNKNVKFPNQIFLETISNKSSALESREVPLNRNAYVFSVDYNGIYKSDILNFHKYLMIKNIK